MTSVPAFTHMGAIMSIRLAAAALAALFVAGSAQASDTDPCGTSMICASSPKTIVDAIQKAGYKAALDKDDDGDPMIESAANGYDFTIYFYECEKAKDCASLQFVASFEDDGANNAALANAWNHKKRFIQMSVDDDGSLNARYDISTLGGLNQKNFADVVDWWAHMLGELGQFFREQPAPKKQG
jgi:hypothetical protein